MKNKTPHIITTVLRSLIFDSLSYSVVTAFLNGEEQYRYQVVEVNEHGETQRTVFESSGSREYCFKAFKLLQKEPEQPKKEPTQRNKIRNDNTNDIHNTAKKYGWEYSGDVNLEHGGFFFKLGDWSSYDYCEAVEVSLHEDRFDGGALYVTVGSINRKSDLCTDEALAEVYGAEIVDGVDDIDLPDARTCLEIDHCKSNYGVEGSYNNGEAFELSDCGEYFNANNNKQNGKAQWIAVDDLQGWIVAKYLKGGN